MQFQEREKIINHLAKADSLYYAIGMAITILELALIATNTKFGVAGLELSFLIQIIFSVIIESSAGLFFLKSGPYLTATYGMYAKTLAVTLLAGAIFSSNFLNLTVTWGILITFFITDGVGSGCLLSAFRPAYAQWYADKMNYQEEADFLKIYKRKFLLRIGFPMVILLLSAFFFYATQRAGFLSANPYLFASITIIGTMLVTRLYQLRMTISDFKGLAVCKVKNKVNEDDEAVTFNSFIHSITKIKNNLVVYVVGNIAFLSIMMYAIGLGFKLTTQLHMPFYLAWLGGALIGFIIYLFSSVFGFFIYPKFGEAFHHHKLALALILLALPASVCLIIFFTNWINYQISILLIFSLTSVTIGNGLLRLMTNVIIREITASHQQVVFILGEALASLFIALAVTISLCLPYPNATIIMLCAFLLLLVCISIVMLMRQSTSADLTPAQ